MSTLRNPNTPTSPLEAMTARFIHDYGVSPSAARFSLLAVLSAALGTSCRIESYSGSTPVPTTLNLALVADHSPFMGEMLREAFSPLLQLQREGIQRNDPKWLKKEESRLMEARQCYLASTDYPDPGHLRYFDEPLRDLRQSRQPCLLLDPSPDEIHDALSESHDETLGVLWVHPEKVTTLIQGWDSRDGEEERMLVTRGWRGQSTVHRRQGRVEIELAQPCLSLALAAGKEDLHRLLSLPNLVTAGVAGTFLIAGMDDSCVADAVTLTSGEDAIRRWPNLLSAAFHRRRSGETLTLRLSSRARRIFECFRDKLWNRDLPDGQRSLAAMWPEQTLRLAGLLHYAGGGGATTVVGRESVIAAVRVVMESIRQQTALLRLESKPGPVEQFVEACVVLKPKEDLTVSRAFDLFMMFCKLNELPVPLRKDFNSEFTSILRGKFQICQRGDIPGGNGKAQDGWRGVAMRIPESKAEPASAQPATNPDSPERPEPHGISSYDL